MTFSIPVRQRDHRVSWRAVVVLENGRYIRTARYRSMSRVANIVARRAGPSTSTAACRCARTPALTTSETWCPHAGCYRVELDQPAGWCALPRADRRCRPNDPRGPVILVGQPTSLARRGSMYRAIQLQTVSSARREAPCACSRRGSMKLISSRWKLGKRSGRRSGRSPGTLA